MSKTTETKSEGNKAKPADSDAIAALAAFRHEVIRYLNFSKQAAESHGITGQQYQAMLFMKGLSENGRLSIGELAQAMFSTHHAAVELVDRMEAAGLLERKVEEWDRRRVSVELTPEGEKKLQKLATLHLRELSHSDLAKQLKKFSPS